MNQTALAEEYIEGREIYVSLIGNERLRVFPLREVIFTEVPETSRSFPRLKPSGTKRTGSVGESRMFSPSRLRTAFSSAWQECAKRSIAPCAFAVTAVSTCE